MGITSVLAMAGAAGLSAMSPSHTVYSFMDLSGVIQHPLTSSYPLAGQGVGQIAVNMSEEKTFHVISVYGDVLVGKVPSSHNGNIEITCQQTSNMHKFLLYTYQTVVMAEAREWARMAALLRCISDGVEHNITGLSFNKIPGKVYATNGTMVIWRLDAASIESTAPNPSGAGSSLLGSITPSFLR